MARGRMLNRTISLDPEVAELVNKLGGLSGLLYTWIIAHLDRDGRISGNPLVLCAQVTPLIAGVTPDLVRSMLAEAHRLGLVEVYCAGGKDWVTYPKFEQNQKGMRYDREAAGVTPATSGVTPEWVRTNSTRKQSKAKESNGKESNSIRPSPATAGSSRDQKIGEVADHYRAKNPGRGKQLKKGHKDWNRIGERLDEDWTVEELKLAVDGNLIEKWHVDNRKHSVEFVFRNAGKVETFIDIAKNGNPTPGRKPTYLDVSRELMEGYKNEDEQNRGDQTVDAPAGSLRLTGGRPPDVGGDGD